MVWYLREAAADGLPAQRQPGAAGDQGRPKTAKPPQEWEACPGREIGPSPTQKEGGELPAVPGRVLTSGTGVKPLPSFPESSLLPRVLG